MIGDLYFPVQTGHARVSFHDGFLDPRPRGPHYGIDIGSTMGTRIYCAARGRVVRQCNLGGTRGTPGVGHGTQGGNYAVIAGDNGCFYYYAHMRDTARVQPGDPVNAGQLIGYMGNTGRGRGTGPVHLHFQVWIPFRHPRAAQEYEQLVFNLRFGRSLNPFSQLRAAAINLPGASSGTVNVPGRGMMGSVIIDAPTAEDRQRRLDDLMDRAAGTGPMPFS
jgi:murein DD-endopeptidase MepM/ murein hydrolase activator NlpD